MSTRRTKWTVAAAAALAALVMTAGPTVRAQSTGQVLLQEPFTGPTTAASVLTLNTNAPGYPCLTADPAGAQGGSTIPNCGLATPDPVGQGALRFTGVTEQQASGFVADTSLPTAQGLTIAFTQYQYGGYGIGGPGNPGGADGISIFLAVAPPSPQTLGPQGGALGYASAGSAPGLPGGWLGIGLDAFGNYSNPAFGGAACAVPPWAGFNPDSVTVRGPGHGTDGYCLIESSANPISSAMQPQTVALSSLRDADRASSARTVTVQITPSDGLFRVFVDDGAGSITSVVGALPTSYYDPTTGAVVQGVPPRITFGFAASTGSATDIHEIANLTASTVTGGVPLLGLSKTTSLTASPVPGEGFDYVITPRIDGTVDEADPLSLRVNDNLPAGVTLAGSASGLAWQCTPTSATAFDCGYTDPNPIPAGTTLPSITVPVMIDPAVAPGTTIVNTASALSDDAAAPVDASVAVTVVAPLPPLAITTTSVPNGTEGTAYSTTLAATGGSGTRTWTVSAGALPAGISLSTAGVLDGTPTVSGTFPFTARVADSTGADTRGLTLTIAPPLTITTTSIPGATDGAMYATTLSAAGGSGPHTWTISAGALPSGISLSTGGRLAGRPTVSGTFPFTARVVDSTGADTQALTLTVAAAAPPLTITTTSLPGATQGTSYSTTLAATGGSGLRTWTISAGALPGGVSLSSVGGLAGTPTVSGTFGVTVRVADSTGADTQPLSLVVAPPPSSPLVITTTTLPPAEVGAGYTHPLAATGGAPPYQWTVQADAPPAGLTLTPAGVLTGVPTRAGGQAFTGRVTDSASRFVQRRFWLPVRDALAILTSTLPDGSVGTPYRAVLVRSGGMAPFIWTLTSGALPAGLSLSAAGVISGTPTALGTSSFWVRVTDPLGGVASRQFTVAIYRPQKAYLADPYACGKWECQGRLRVVSLASGQDVGVIDLGVVLRGSIGVVANPNGTRVYAVTSSFGTPATLRSIDTATDHVVHAMAWAARGWPVVSPDGTTLYYVKVHSWSPYVWSLAALDTSTHQESVLATEARAFAGKLLISPDGNLIHAVKSAVNYEPADISTYTKTGTLLRRLTLGYDGLMDATLTPNGGRLLVAVQRTQPTQYWLYDINTASNVVTDQFQTASWLWDLVSPDDASLWGIEGSLQRVEDYSLVTNTLLRRIPTQVARMAADPTKPGAYVIVTMGSGTSAIGRIDAQGGGVRLVTPTSAGTPWPMAIAKGGN